MATWSAASRSVVDLLRLVGNIDAVSGPYYLFMHAWTRVFGDSVLALRVPSVLAMTASAALTAVLAARLFGPRAGLIAGLLFAVVPSTSRYGQEARSYAFATLFAVLATLLLWRALAAPTWRRWVWYAAALAGLGLAHLAAITLVAGHAVAALLAWRDGRTERGDGPTATGQGWPVRAAVACGLAGLVVAPLAVLGFGQQGQQLEWVAPARLGDLSRLPGAVLQTRTVGGMLVGLAAIGMSTRRRWGPALGACTALPAVILFIAGLVAPLWVPRYLVFVVPFGCVLAGAALARLRLPAVLLVVALVALFGAPAQNALRRTHEWPRTHPIDYVRAAQIIGERQRPGDGIVYSPRDGWKFLDTAVAYQLRKRAPRDLLAVRDPVRRGSLWTAECAEPARCLAPADRVWLLVTGERSDPLRGVSAAKAAALRAGFATEQVWQVPGLTVALLVRR